MPADDVAFHAKLRPDALAIADLAFGKRWTYAEFDDAVARCAGALSARGVARGDRVAALSKNRAELPMLHFACARLGAIYVPLNWRLSRSELQGLIEDAEPKLLFLDARLEDASIDGIDLDAFGAEMKAADPFQCRSANPDLPSLILFTSGTSGRPKGALLTERNLAEAAINFSMLGAVTENSVFLCDAPMFHVIGLVANVRPAMMRGGAVLISDAFLPERTLQRLGDPALKVTHYFCVPQMASRLRADKSFGPDRLRGLTGIFTGGAPHPEANIRAWLADHIPVVNGFGMSETGTVFGMPVELEQIEKRIGAVGISTPRVQSRIVDSDDKDVAFGEAGELLLKGDNVFREYWRRPEETKAAFTDDGWFRTGDIARINEEGFHWLVDRRKDMYISGGENVYPAEIEAAIAGHPGLRECAVVGAPDDKWGEVGHLYAVLEPDAAVTPEDIKTALGEKLARYKLPKYVSIIDRLPRNGAGKVMKPELRMKAREERSS